MTDQPITTKDWPLIQTADGYWRHVNHELQLLTAGWLYYEGAVKNAAGYRTDKAAQELMYNRYQEFFNAR
jgi:hypothetical protein